MGVIDIDPPNVLTILLIAWGAIIAWSLFIMLVSGTLGGSNAEEVVEP